MPSYSKVTVFTYATCMTKYTWNYLLCQHNHKKQEYEIIGIIYTHMHAYIHTLSYLEMLSSQDYGFLD